MSLHSQKVLSIAVQYSIPATLLQCGKQTTNRKIFFVLHLVGILQGWFKEEITKNAV